MNMTKTIEIFFKRYMPSPFTIAIILTLLTIMLAMLFTEPIEEGTQFFNILSFWESGIWNSGLLVFAYQMMLILVLGHVLVLSGPANRMIVKLSKNVSNTTSAVVLVSITTMLAAFLNWGLGLIFGAILARKVGEYAQQNNIPLNYPLVGAAGYVGLMVWHGGISGSAPIKVAETNHIIDFMSGVSSIEILDKIPESIDFNQTIFSWWNLLLFGVLLVIVPLILRGIAKITEPTEFNLKTYNFNEDLSKNREGAEKLDYSKMLGFGFGALLLCAFFYQYWNQLVSLKITPNMLNFFMLGLAITLHGRIKNFLNALKEAIKGTSGILIQFPLYFGIMGIMKSTGMVVMISDFFVSVATTTTLPIFTFFSAGLVNIFVPSGGGQWAIQGPIVIESAIKLGVPLPKAIMALAYGDQITNMSAFLGITTFRDYKIKSKRNTALYAYTHDCWYSHLRSWIAHFIIILKMHLLSEKLEFPDISKISKEGLVAFGGDLSVERLILAYSKGIFPWFEACDPILWWSPDPRFVLYPNELKVSKSLNKTLRNGEFEVTYDLNFWEVVTACSKIKRKGQKGTWITSEMIQAYCDLFELGFAKSIEVWRNNELVGGFYGVDLNNGVFCGESMFSKVSNASKVGFVSKFWMNLAIWYCVKLRSRS